MSSVWEFESFDSEQIFSTFLIQINFPSYWKTVETKLSQESHINPAQWFNHQGNSSLFKIVIDKLTFIINILVVISNKLLPQPELNLYISFLN